jgi:hypothetical protein
MGHSSSMVISTNITRSFAGTAYVVSGSIELTTSADSPLQLTAAHVLLQQQGPDGSPLLLQQVPADCQRDITSSIATSYVTLQPGRVLVCPFAAQLIYLSTSAPTVIGQAQITGAGLVSSFPAKAWVSLPPAHQAAAAWAGSSSSSSSSSGPGIGNGTPGVMKLGHCAIATDTFESGGLYLAPTALSAGMKLPPLGAGSSMCEGSYQSMYQVSFGPFNSSITRCSTFKVGSGYWGSVSLKPFLPKAHSMGAFWYHYCRQKPLPSRYKGYRSSVAPQDGRRLTAVLNTSETNVFKLDVCRAFAAWWAWPCLNGLPLSMHFVGYAVYVVACR